MSKLQRISPGYFKIVRSKKDEKRLERMRDSIVRPNALEIEMPRRASCVSSRAYGKRPEGKTDVIRNDKK